MRIRTSDSWIQIKEAQKVTDPTDVIRLRNTEMNARNVFFNDLV
jgi:hypothetical protein